MINIDKVYDVEIDWNGRSADRQKFSNCYISFAKYFDEEFQTDRELTEEELYSLLDDDPYWCHKQFENYFY